MPITHVNMFSCLGGIPFGFESVNDEIQTVMLHEPNKACRHVLSHYWDAPVAANLNQFLEGVQEYGKIDVLSARYRGKHWPVVLSAIRKTRSKVVIIESMASLRSRGLVRVLKDLWSLGYDAEGHVISACSLGAIYKGERFWIVAYPNPDGFTPDSIIEKAEGGLGKQYVTDDLLDEYRTWLERNRQTAKGSVFDQPRILRRDDGLSRRVDATRVRFLSDDASPLVAGFIGFCLSRILDDKFLPLPPKFMSVTDHVRNVTKKTNLILNTQRLDEEGIEYNKKNDGMHLVIPAAGQFVDYWPSTDVFIVRGTSIRGEGVEKVIQTVRHIVERRDA